MNNSGMAGEEVIVDLTADFTPGGSGGVFYPGDPTRSYDRRMTDRPLTDTRSRLTTHPVPGDAVAIAVNTTTTGREGSWYTAITHSPITLDLNGQLLATPDDQDHGAMTGVGAS